MRIRRTISREARVDRDARLTQTQGIFDLPVATLQQLSWAIDLVLPDVWSVGAIVGGSGSGKTTVAREMAQSLAGKVIEAKDADGNLHEPFEWPRNKAVCSATALPIREWTGLLSRVGFSSPPAWCRPYQVLSQGQQFRVNLARSIAEAGEAPIFFDEFASLVHDEVAKVAAAAVAKAVRSMNRRFVAVTWRQDVLDSLEPDWVIFVGTDQSVTLRLNDADASRGSVRRWTRPQTAIRIRRVEAASAWPLFKSHHYLSANLHRSAKCFVGYVGSEPATFTAALPFPHPTVPAWREHRMVCLPDFQGGGLGNLVSEYIASLFVATGRPYNSTTGHPAMISHRRRSPCWRVIRQAGLNRLAKKTDIPGMLATVANDRYTMSFGYVGPTRLDDARRFGVC